MISLKIQCGCGQRYAFDVEPVGGRMPSAVTCPACGADGTAAANAAIAQIMPAQPAVAAAGVAPVNITAPTPASPTARREPARLPGQIDPNQARHEARAKMLWGDSREQVVQFLRIQGFSQEDASALAEELFRERVATIRANGVRKIMIGSGLISVPIITFLIFLSIGIFFMKVLALTVMAGLYGVWLVVKGSFMVLTPKSEAGDASKM